MIIFKKVVDGEYGGRGKTEFTRCPSRKSHTRRPLPPGHFDTDSDSTAGQSDNDSVGYNNGDNYGLLDTLNSQKFCQNSRLIKLVRRKKRKLAKEKRWLAMVSPTVTNNNGNKTMSRMNNGNNNNLNNSNAQNIPNNAQNTQTQNAATENAINNTMNSLLSMKVPNRNQNRMNKQNSMNAAINTTNARFKSPYKSPSASMSRGRRALYKAQKAQQNRMNKANNNGKPQKIQNTPIVKGTPIVQKVTKMAAMRMASLDQINETEDNGNEADNDNDIDDDIMMNTNNNNGSVPPQDMINNANNATKKTSSELITNTHETNEERKDNSHENSPKQTNPAPNDARDDDMEDAETLSDEMKTDEKTGNSLDIAYEDDEDDDLILDDLRNGATKSGPTATTVSVSISKSSPKPVPTPNINSLFMPKNKSDVTQDDNGRNMINSNSNSNRNSIKSNHNPNPTENNTANRVQEERERQYESIGIQSKSPSQDPDPQQLNFNLTSPMRSGPEPEIIVPASPQMIQQSTSTSTSNTLSMGSKMSPMDFAQRTSGRQIIPKNRNSSYLEQHSFSVGLGSSSYSRSIATQTERVPCEIGIQVDMSMDNMNSMADIPYVVMKDTPKEITTSSGAVFRRVYPAVNDEKEPEADIEPEHSNHYGSVSESENENDDDVIMDENEIKDKSRSPSNEPQLVKENGVESEISLQPQAQSQRMEVVPQRELSPVIEEEPESNEKEATPTPTQIESEPKEKATTTAIQTGPEVDIVSNATEASETEKSNETPPPEQRLQSLSLNIQNAAPIPVPVNNENLGLNAQITNNNNTKKDRSHLKRKYDEALENDDDTTEHNADDELSKEPTPIKRRKVNNTKKVKRTNSEQRIKYQKKDLVWTMDEYQTMHPTLILTCFYDPNERFYPSGYEILWLPYIDLEGPRNGKCSLTEEPYFNIKSMVSDKELDQRVKNGEGFVDAAWNEIKTHRPDIYRKYKDSRGRLRSTKPKKVKRKRRASVM